MSRRRLVRALDLVDDARLIADYRNWHGPGSVWPEVLAHIRATGVLEMEIWNVGNRLFMILEVVEDFPRDVAEPVRVAEWERLMSTFQQPLSGGVPGEKWIGLTRIFSLDETGGRE
jgi:L-rhamnose mutarotase